jgi:hypothetical protein
MIKIIFVFKRRELEGTLVPSSREREGLKPSL